MSSLRALAAAVVVAAYFLSMLLGVALPADMLLASLMVIGLPEAVRHGRSHAARQAEHEMPGWLLSAQDAFACTIGAICAAGLAWAMWGRAGMAADFRIAALLYLLSLLMLATSFSLGAKAYRP